MEGKGKGVNEKKEGGKVVDQTKVDNRDEWKGINITKYMKHCFMDAFWPKMVHSTSIYLDEMWQHHPISYVG